MTSLRVGIVVVTYNRLSMLRKTLDACLAQPEASCLYIVDNASTDGTTEYLAEMASMHSCITVLTQHTNLGGAGGFAVGMQRALDDGCQWMWLMDDDVLPTPDGLATLLASAGHARCLYPAKRCADGRMFDFEYRISRATLKRWRISSVDGLAQDAQLPTNSGNFEGAFIHRDVVERIGLPDARFFIGWDDAFWGMKAAEHFDCRYLNHVCIIKQQDKERLHIAGKGFYSSSLYSRFYFLRNYWEVIRYLINKDELSAWAYMRYGWEFVKACILTAVIERNPCGLAVLCKALTQGLSKNFCKLETI